MRKIFLFLLIIISFQSFGQNPANYQYRNVFERSRGGMFDSALTIPRYSSRPSGVRSGSATHAGLLALDTNNHIPSYYSGGIWRDFQPIRDGLYSGGIVTWDSLLVFTVSAAVYYINGVRYETALTHITLDAANGSNPRIDLIVATASGISKITGTAAASPAEANLPIDNIRLTAIYVNTSATTPTGPVNKIIWDENTEFTGAATSVTVDFDNFADPYHFLKASSAGAVTSSSFITYTGTDFSITPYNTFKFFVKLKASFAAGTRFQITWYKDGVQVSTTLTVTSGTYGFLRTSGTYQEITIPVFDFGISTEQVDQVKFSLSGSNGSGFYLDYIQLKGGIQQPTGGLNRFGVSGEDAVATQNRYFNGKNTYFFNIDSIPSFSLTAAQTRFKNIAGSDWLKYLPLTTGLNIDPLSTSIPVTISNIPYNSSAALVHLAIDTSVSPNRLYRKTASSSGSQTLQQVFDTEVGGSVLTKTDTILTNANTLKVITSTAGVNPLLVKATTGFGVQSQVTTGYAVYGLATGANGTGTMGNTTGTSGTNTGIYGLAEGSGATTNRGAVFEATNATNNYAIVVPSGSGRVGFGTVSPNASAILDLTSTSHGFLVPRMTEAQRDAIGTPATGLLIYQTDGTAGFYYYDGADWTGVGGSGGVTAANLPLRISGSTVSADTSVAYSPSLTTNARLQKVLDSLKALGNSEPWYKWYMDVGNPSNAFMWRNTATGGSITTNGSIFDNWMNSVDYSTGVTNNGHAYSHHGNNGIVQPIAISNSYRYNYGIKVRLEDLSDGTDTYRVWAGFADDHTTFANIVDGVYFSYTDGESSGQWVCITKSNSSATTTASGITVAADTDYELEISVYNGNAYFFINKVLVHTETSTIPTGTTRATSMNHVIKKSAGTNPRVMYIEWMAYGKRTN